MSPRRLGIQLYSLVSPKRVGGASSLGGALYEAQGCHL